MTKVCLEQPLAYFEEDYYYPSFLVSSINDKDQTVQLDLIQIHLSRVCNAMRWDFDQQAQLFLKHYCPEAEIVILPDDPCPRVTAILSHSEYDALTTAIREEAKPGVVLFEC